MSGASAEERRLERWRLVLGEESCEALDAAGGCGTLSGRAAERDRALAWLYDRERAAARNVRAMHARAGAQPGGSAQVGGTHAGGDPRGGLGPSDPYVPAWLASVDRLFPRSVAQRIERDALERYGLLALATDPDVLARATPDLALLRVVLATRHLMAPEVLAQARRIVAVVVEDLRRRLAAPVSSPLRGVRDPRRRSRHRIAANLDALATMRANLHRYDPASGRLAIAEPLFVSRTRRDADRWQVVVLVDQSGSMADNVVHAAVTASIFAELGASMRTHLVAFDTAVVDLTDVAGDPTEVLMRVQLGGGTDITRALRYAAGLVERPRRTIVVLVSDFYEGAGEREMLAEVRELVTSGVTLLALGALTTDSRPAYDERMAQQIVALGGHAGAMTPDELATWVAERVRA